MCDVHTVMCSMCVEANRLHLQQAQYRESLSSLNLASDAAGITVCIVTVTMRFRHIYIEQAGHHGHYVQAPWSGQAYGEDSQ